MARCTRLRLSASIPETDLALVKISAETNFPYVRLALDLPRIGDWVLPADVPADVEIGGAALLALSR